MHRATSVCHYHDITTIAFCKIIRKCVPLCFKHRVYITFSCVPTAKYLVSILFNNIIRKQSACINLCFSLRNAVDIFLEPLFIVLIKSLTISVHGIRAYISILDIFPSVSRHLTFGNVNVSSHLRKHLAIFCLR